MSTIAQPGEGLRVGFVGAGLVTQSIHLPTLARLGGTFRTVHLSDPNVAVVEAVAARVGARHSVDATSVIDDPEVDVVAICSPYQFHAEQVIAAARAGKRAVLVEKPFVVTAEEAERVARVIAETGIPLLVGAMHTFDPAWLAARAGWGDLDRTAHTIRSSIVLPPNSRFEDVATEILERPDFPPRDASDAAVQAAMVHAGVTGLAIHDLPLVRAFLPSFADLTVLAARAIEPFGYHIVFTAGGRVVELHAAITSTWRPEWIFEAVSDNQALRIEFTPSYVQAGSGTAVLCTASGIQSFAPAPGNGYEGEWRALADVALGRSSPPEPVELIDDLRLAVELAEQAAQVVRSTASAPAAELQVR